MRELAPTLTRNAAACRSRLLLRVGLFGFYIVGRFRVWGVPQYLGRQVYEVHCGSQGCHTLRLALPQEPWSLWSQGKEVLVGGEEEEVVVVVEKQDY